MGTKCGSKLHKIQLKMISTVAPLKKMGEKGQNLANNEPLIYSDTQTGIFTQKQSMKMKNRAPENTENSLTNNKTKARMPQSCSNYQKQLQRLFGEKLDFLSGLYCFLFVCLIVP